MSSYAEKTLQHWQKFSDQILSDTKAGEEILLALNGEESDFIRFNNGKVRQSTYVDHFTVSLQLQKDLRQIKVQFQLSHNMDQDLKKAASLISRCRQELSALPADPMIVAMKNNGQSQNIFQAEVPTSQQVVEQIVELTSPVDFAGFYSGGPIYRASRNSCGQSHFYANQSFFYDYSLFTVSDESKENKAVKGTYSEKNWQTQNLRSLLESHKQQLQNLKKPSRQLKPGTYRVYLAPGAVAEIAGMFSWGSFSYAAYKQGRSPMVKLAEKTETFSEKFHLYENFQLGLAPRFNSMGEVAPEKIALIQEGKHKNWMISAKSAKEYSAESNAAETTDWFYEAIRCAEILPGGMPEDKALENLGTGVYLGNLHYINWSDVPNARITGMTRYACFWVENGQIVAPIKDMRFDESLYRIFGSELVDLTKTQAVEPNVDTYLKRELGGKKVPGALVKEFRFTL
jgi:predicted Zn-dependent protease